MKTLYFGLSIFNIIYDMKIFTKIFIAGVLLVAYGTGYSASLTYGFRGEGFYLPSDPMGPQVNTQSWASYSGSRLASASFLGAFDFTSLNAGLAKSIKLPQRFSNNFTANTSKGAMLGVRMINTHSSLDEGTAKPTLSAYPNPTRGILEIKLTQASREAYKITLSNTIGQVVKIIKVPESAHNSGIKLDISTYPAGIYFYSLLINDKMVETKRLILQQ